MNWQGGFYGNALQSATANDRWEIVQLLVEHDADVNAQGGHYGNALTAAARHRAHFQEMTELFLRNGADIDAQGLGVYGNPLQTAVWVGHVESVEFLLQHGASKTISGRFGSAIEIGETGVRNKNDETTRQGILKLLLGGRMGFVSTRYNG